MTGFLPAARLARAHKATAGAGLDALLLTPGADLRYLTGYDAHPLERLTCLVLTASGSAALVVPELEKAAAEASAAGGLDLPIVSWPEGGDAYAVVRDLLRDAGGGAPGPGDRPRRAGRRRHRRPHARRLLLGLDPGVLPRGSAGGVRRVLRRAPGRPGAGVRRGPARGDRGRGRRRLPGADRGRRVR